MKQTLLPHIHIWLHDWCNPTIFIIRKMRDYAPFMYDLSKCINAFYHYVQLIRIKKERTFLLEILLSVLHSKSTSREKARAIMSLSSLLHSWILVLSCTACCAMFANNCFIYFVQFSRCLSQKPDPVSYMTNGIRTPFHKICSN